MIRGVLPEGDRFRVETCSSSKEDLVFAVLPVTLISARAGVCINIFFVQVHGYESR